MAFDPATAYLVGGIGSSLLSGIFGSSAQSSANAQNTANTMMTNAYNLAINKQNREFVENMWNKTNEYNTLKAQRQRAEEAGINPYFALGTMTGGNATAATAPQSISMQSPQVQPNFAAANAIQGVGQSVQNFMLQKAQADNLNADTQAKYVDNQYKSIHNILDLRNKLADLKNKISDTKLKDEERRSLGSQIRKLQNEIKDQEFQLKYRDEYYKAESDEKRNLANMAYQKAREAAAQADLAELTKEAFPALNKAQIDLLASQTYQAAQAGRLSAKMSETEMAKKIGQIIENGIKSNQFKLSQFGISSAELNSLRDGDIARIKKNSKLFDLVDGALNWVTTTAGKVFHASYDFSR